MKKDVYDAAEEGRHWWCRVSWQGCEGYVLGDSVHESETTLH